MGSRITRYEPDNILSGIQTFTEWDDISGKNFKYYSGERFFKISRRYYTNDFQRGYIFGYYNLTDDDLGGDGSLERAF